MAKDEKSGKIRLLLVELEGSNDTLQEALQMVAQSLNRPVVPVRAMTAQRPTAALPGTGVPSEAIYTDIIEEESFEDEVPVIKKRTKARAYRPPEMLKDLDLQSGDMSFEDFYKQKNPESHLDKYLVIAQWLKEHRGVDLIDVQYIYTIYRYMNWSVLQDIDSVFRKSLGSGKFAREGKGEYSITIAGENTVRKMDS